MMNLDEILRGIGQQMARAVPNWASPPEPQTDGESPFVGGLGSFGSYLSSGMSPFVQGPGNQFSGSVYVPSSHAQRAAMDVVTSAKAGSAANAAATGVSVTPDMSSHQSWVQSMTPLAKAWEAKTGIPAEYFLAANASESNWGNAPGNELFGIKAHGGNTSMNMGTWEYGQGSTNADFSTYASPDAAYSDFVNLISNGRYANAWQQFQQDRDPSKLFANLNSAGYATDPNWHANIDSLAAQIRPMMPKGGNQTMGVEDANPQAPPADAHGGRPSQFDPSLNAAEQLAACGPTAAAAMAGAFGKTVSVRQAVDMARNGGLWNANVGMYGPQSEITLLGQMGIQAHAESVNWDRVNQSASPTSPVIVDTPGHYFYIDGSDGRGNYHVGTSGTDLKHGSEWMTPAQMASVMGTPRSLIFAG